MLTANGRGTLWDHLPSCCVSAVVNKYIVNCRQILGGLGCFPPTEEAPLGPPAQRSFCCKILMQSHAKKSDAADVEKTSTMLVFYLFVPKLKCLVYDLVIHGVGNNWVPIGKTVT